MENLTSVLQAILSFLGVVLVAIIGYISSMGLLKKQDEQNKAKKEQEIQEIVTRQFKMLTDELQEEREVLKNQVEEQSKTIESLKSKIKELEKARSEDFDAFEKEKESMRRTFGRKEQGYENAINGLTRRVAELEGRLAGVEKNTDRLRRK